MLFCLDCMIWSRAKINYSFIFEYDSRHTLDWRQLAEVCLHTFDFDCSLTDLDTLYFLSSSWSFHVGQLLMG